MRRWNNMKEEYFTFTVSEKVGILVLLFLIVVVNAMIFLVPVIFPPAEVDCAEFDEFVCSYNSNLNRLRRNENEPDTKEDRVQESTDPETKIHLKQKSDSVRLFDFDPNQVSDEELIRLGFNKFQRRNLIKYRSKGGFFSKPNDLLKIYGVDSVLFCRLNPYIKFRDDQSEKILRNINEKRIDINSADSAMFVALPDVNPFLARRICRYRSLLGGFVAKEQLLEVYGLSDSIYDKIESLFLVDKNGVSKIRINFSDYNELVRHPYIDKTMAATMLRLRRLNGPLSLQNLFESIDIDSLKEEQLKAYLNFE